MNGKQGKTAKYSFGLLETPDTCSSSTSTNSRNDSSTTSTTVAPTNHKVATETSNGDTFSHTSSNTSGNARGRASSGRSNCINTPARFTGGSISSRSKTPGTFKTPRTPAIRKTPRTPFTSSSMTHSVDTPSSIIVAIVEGRGLARGEIGLASIDLKCPVLTMSQFSDTQRYVKTMTKLQILKPLEIVLPNTACEYGNATKLFQMISDKFQRTTISTVQRRYFNETKGLQYVNQLCLADYKTVEMEVSAKYYCLATAAALLKYVEFIQNIMYAPNSLKIVFKGSEHTTMIDAVTARNLELLENHRDPKSNQTLYGVLNYTHTPGGARLLRSNILQPPSDLETVKMRQDVVKELTEKEEVFYNLKGVLGKFLDVDHLISHCVQISKQDSVKVGEANINAVICLKHVLGLVPVLQEFLKDCENLLLKAYCKTLEDARFDLILSKINLIIHEDTKYQKGTLPMRTQKCFAVKPEVNGLLDVARRAYAEIVDDITAVIKQLGKQFNLPLKSAFSTVRGFYIQLYCGGKNNISAKDLPNVFIKVTKFKNTLNFTTADLIKLNDRVQSSLDEIYMMTNIVMKELLMSVREFISVLYKLSEIVSTLDMLLAFAHACTLSAYVCPEFTDTLAIKMGRHPVLEKITAATTVPNNTYAAQDSNFVVITGPNMSGKSTYLKQVALLQIMAQIGSFVPAEYASFRMTSQIFSRVGSDDDMETNSSTFTLEMKEMNYITQNATNNSLIIVDELGRGTSAEEGVGICWAVCEYLLKTKAFTFFVTHFKDLTTLDHLYANVENYYFEVQRTFSREGSCEKITYTHLLSRGKTPEQHYGLKLAEMSTLPVWVLHEAQQLASQLDAIKQKCETVDPEVARQKAVFKLTTKLLQLARNSRLEETSLRAYLTSLQQQHISLPTHHLDPERTGSSTSQQSFQNPEREASNINQPEYQGHDREGSHTNQPMYQNCDREDSCSSKHEYQSCIKGHARKNQHEYQCHDGEDSRKVQHIYASCGKRDARPSQQAIQTLDRQDSHTSYQASLNHDKEVPFLSHQAFQGHNGEDSRSSHQAFQSCDNEDSHTNQILQNPEREDLCTNQQFQNQPAIHQQQEECDVQERNSALHLQKDHPQELHRTFRQPFQECRKNRQGYEEQPAENVYQQKQRSVTPEQHHQEEHEQSLTWRRPAQEKQHESQADNLCCHNNTDAAKKSHSNLQARFHLIDEEHSLQQNYSEVSRQLSEGTEKGQGGPHHKRPHSVSVTPETTQGYCPEKQRKQQNKNFESCVLSSVHEC